MPSWSGADKCRRPTFRAVLWNKTGWRLGEGNNKNNACMQPEFKFGDIYLCDGTHVKLHVNTAAFLLQN